jgi:hypothetical protein
MPPLRPRPRLAPAGPLLFLAAVVPAALAAGAPPPANNKPNPGAPAADIRKAASPGSLPAALIQTHKKAPVPHKPFAVVDPQSGKQVKPETMLTLPNGKKVKAGDYYAKLNQLEKQFNGLGHSLRDTAQRVLLQETKIDKGNLEKQGRAVAAKHQAFDPRTMRKPTPLTALAAAHQAAVKKAPPPAALRAAAAGGGKKDHELKSFNFSVGDNKTAAAYLTGQMEVNVAQDAADLKGEAHAGVGLVNQKLELLTATVQAHVGGGTDANANLDVSVLGESLFHVNQAVKTTWNHHDQKTKTVEQSASFSFSLGGIPVSAKVGARGSVGVEFSVAVTALPPLASAEVKPQASVDAYAQAGLDIVIASAGVEASLQLLHVSLTLGTEVGVKTDNQGPYLSLFVHAEDDITLLNGSLSFYLEIYVPSILDPTKEGPHKDPPGRGNAGQSRPQPGIGRSVLDAFFTKKRYDFSFFNWTGLKKQGTLFNVPRKTPLPKVAAKSPAKTNGPH